MELMQVISTQLCRITKYSWLVFTPLFLVACASTPTSVDVENEDVETIESPQQPAVEEPVEPQKTEVIEAPEVPQIPLNAELMYYILTAEVAGQRGEMGVAVDLYAKAADMVDSTTLAGRSAQVATFTRDKERIDRALKRWLQIEPDNADVYMMQAPIALLNKDAQAALDAINEALKIAPESSAEYLSTMSESLRELAEPKLGLAFMRSVDLYRQNDPEAIFATARLALKYKQYKEALIEAEKVLQVQPDRQEAIVIKAEALLRLGESEKSLALIKHAMDDEKAGEAVKFAYAKALGETGNTEQAKQVFEELHQINPENEDYIFALGLIALENKQTVAAKKYFNLLIKNGDPGKQSAYFMALAEEMDGNLDAALAWYSSVSAQSSRFDSAQSNYVTILAKQGKMAQAREHLKLMRQQFPGREVDFYLYEAAFLRERNMGQEGFDLYNEAIDKYPENLDLRYARAMAAEPLDKLDVLESDLRLILQKQPDNANALNALGYTLTDRTDRHDEAFVLIQKAVDIAPKNAFYLDSLGWVYYKLGDLENAEKYLQEAVAIQGDAEFLAHLGEVIWERGRHEEAKQIWLKAKQLSKDNKILLETMSRYGQ
jgi:tetratricopeptide (TPR) repeat protein